MRLKIKYYLALFFLFLTVNLIIMIYHNKKVNTDCKINETLIINNRIISNNKDSHEEFCENKNKYIRYECKRPFCGGWADRLRGLMSAYIWAIFTKREFLIDMDYPCSLSLMLEPNFVKWNKPIKCYDYFNNTIINQKEPFTSVRLDKVSNKNFYLLLRDIDIFEYYKEANLITIRNNLDWIYAFSFNKHLNHSIYEFGYKPSNFRLYYFFRKFYNNLFKLTPKLQESYEKFIKQAKPDNQTKLICAQVRIGGIRPNVAFDQQFTSRNNSKLFWKFIRENFLNINPKQKYKIFITTDTESVEEESIQEFGRNNVVKIDGPFVHIDREEVGNISDCSKIEKIILDFHAIQLCDSVVISQSGFGRLGISNRIDPTKDLWRFETIIKKQKSKNNQINIFESYTFNKIGNLSLL
jgi:hypothetical protein